MTFQNQMMSFSLAGSVAEKFSRSGCTWTRGYGKVFYFQPGHETNPTYHNPHVLQIIKNAIRWVAPATPIKEKIECPHAEVSPESKYQK